jgi:hypothetical protein
MNSSTNNIKGRRKPVPRAIFTPTQRASATIAKYYLLFFEETESYQIVAQSSIKKIDDAGSATLAIRNKILKGKIILAGDPFYLTIDFNLLLSLLRFS